MAIGYAELKVRGQLMIIRVTKLLIFLSTFSVYFLRFSVHLFCPPSLMLY